MYVGTQRRKRLLLIEAMAGHFGEGDTSQILIDDKRV